LIKRIQSLANCFLGGYLIIERRMRTNIESQNLNH
jgi:hypothetical protein